MANVVRLGGGGSGAGLNIAYGLTPPTDTTKLWVPLEKKPDNVEVNGEYMNFGQDVLETWKEGDHTIAPYTEMSVAFAASVGDSIYIVEAVTDTIIEYNTVSGMITECCNYVDVTGGTAVAVRPSASFKRGTDIFLAFNVNGSRLYRFDTITKTLELWMTIADATYSAIVEYGGYAYQFVGVTGETSITSYVWQIDLDNKTYTKLEQVIPQKSSSPCAWVYGGKIWLFIEVTGSDVLRLYSFDPNTKEFEEVKSDTQSGSMYKGFGLTCDISFASRNSVFENNAEIPVVGNKVYLYPNKRLDTSKWNGTPFIFDMETLMFTEGSSLIETVGGYGRRDCGFVLRDMGIYLIGGYNYTNAGTTSSTTSKNTKIEVYRIETYLEDNHLKLFTDMFGKQTPLVNGKNCKLYATVREAYIGNEDGYARPTDAYIYDTGTSEWVVIGSVSGGGSSGNGQLTAPEIELVEE